jgi:hypothetical protein
MNYVSSCTVDERCYCSNKKKKDKKKEYGLEQEDTNNELF